MISKTKTQKFFQTCFGQKIIFNWVIDTTFSIFDTVSQGEAPKNEHTWDPTNKLSRSKMLYP